jgi:DNA-binding response OmpR family regulator
MLPSWSPAPAAPIDMLVADAAAAACAAALREHYRLHVVTTAQAAVQHLHQSNPAFLIFDVALGVDVCREAKALTVPSTVLAITDRVEFVPDAIASGCDAVLLKPFQPNLLHARLGRLLRARSAALRLRSQRAYAKAEHLRDRGDLLMSGTNRHWPATYCPYCSHQGITSFEYASHRKEWFACLECKKVWVAKRQE